jgi:type IV pilus assembly protein PilX
MKQSKSIKLTVRYSNSSKSTAQQGIALLTIMIFLLILTVIGISSMQTSRLQQQMAGNTQWSNIAFQVAETGLISSDADTSFNANADPDTGSSGSYSPQEGDPTNIDYRYGRNFVNFSPLLRQNIEEADDFGSKRKANFKTASTGDAKDSGTGVTIATVQLEEGIFIKVPNPNN